MVRGSGFRPVIQVGLAMGKQCLEDTIAYFKYFLG